MVLSKNRKNQICRLFRFIPDKLYIELMYFAHKRKRLHLNDPKTFNEKIQWLKIYDRNPLYPELVDKIRVRDYISRTIGEEYLIPVLGCWERAEDIDFQTLPSQFVLKCNHDSGSAVICKDKGKVNIPALMKHFSIALKQNIYFNGREWPYKEINPCVIAEKYMEDAVSHELRDYKLFCFNGEVKMFKIDFGRFSEHRANYYDRDGNLLPFDEVYCPRDQEASITIPNTINKMISLAEIIARDLPFARVDFYDVNGKIFFGEITLYPASGFGTFRPEEWDYKIGSWLVL